MGTESAGPADFFSVSVAVVVAAAGEAVPVGCLASREVPPAFVAVAAAAGGLSERAAIRSGTAFSGTRVPVGNDDR